MKLIYLFSDGSCLNNPGPGGYGVILRYKDKEKIIRGGEANTTNNRMELLAVIKGLKALKEPCEVRIVSDSKYVVDGINNYLQNWIKKSFKNVKNPDLWQEYLQIANNHKITASWVKGHNLHPENERCDKIAKEEAERFKEQK